MGLATIDAYHAAQAPSDQRICNRLRAEINAGLKAAEAKMWHAHPVWFLAGNSITGYSKLKACIRLMFWSGQSFNTTGLTATGTFKAAEKRYTDTAQIDTAEMQGWLADAVRIQWDYKNIVKRKGALVRLC